MNTPAEHDPRVDEILLELRKITTWLDRQKKISKYALLALPLFFAALVSGLYFFENRAKTLISSSTGDNEAIDWSDVTHALRKSDYTQAVGQARALLKIDAENPRGHYLLGVALLYRGDPEDARAAFAKAVELYPIPEYTEALEALNQRLGATP